MTNVLTRYMSGVTLKIRGSQGQSVVEYLLTMVALVIIFTGMYGFLQGQLRKLFTIAGVKILSTYPK